MNLLKILFAGVFILFLMERRNNRSPESICSDKEKRTELVSLLIAYPEYRKQLIDSIQTHHPKEMIVAVCGLMQKNERFADEMNNAIYNLYATDSVDKPCGD